MKNHLIFYGAGSYAQISIDSLTDMGYVPECFADADSDKHYKFIETKSGTKYEILPLGEAAKRYPDFEIFVSVSPPLFVKVCTDLVSGGIDPKRIRPLPFYNPPPSYRGLFTNFSLLQKRLICNDLKRIEICADYTSVVIDILGGKFIKLHINDDKLPVSSNYLEAGSFEQCERQIMYRILGCLPKDSVIFDIGANLGYYSLCFKKWFPEMKVHAFEPVPSNYDMMLSNFLLNQIDDINSNNFGFFDKEQTIEFFLPTDISGAASIKNILQIEGCKKVKCKVITMDSYVAKVDIRQLSFIKCDVEGAEYFVYRGGVAALEKFRPVVVSEMHRNHSSKFGCHPNDIISLFSKLGYLCYAIGGKNLKPFKQMTDEVVETNFAFIHSSSLENFKTLIDN